MTLSIGAGRGSGIVSHGGSEHGPDDHGRRTRSSIGPVAFMLLAGIALGLLVGYALDRLLHTTPILMLLGVFVGFAIALYGVYLETK